MDIKCCKCKKEYDLAINIFEYKKDTNCPILICPYCGFKHVINFMPFEKRIKVKKIKKLDLAFTVVLLGASRIANATRVDQSEDDDVDIKNGVAWEINSFKFGTKEVDIAENTQIGGLFFKPDGLKMYVVGNGSTGDIIYQYHLTTAWDVSTASYASKFKDVSGQDTSIYGIFFKDDGLKMYIVGNFNNAVFQYTLDTAWDVSTANYADKLKSIATEDISPLGVFFKEDGLKMYVVANDTDRILQYTLGTAWDISTANWDDTDADISGEAINANSIFIKSDGTKMYVGDAGTDQIYQYTLSTPWLASSANYDSKYKTILIGAYGLRGIFFKPDGINLYCAMNDEYIRQFELSVAWTKTNNFILATRIYTSKGPLARAYKLRWRNVTDSGTFADVGATGEITYSATTDLTDEDDLLLTEKLCDVQNGYTWQNGKENEGDNILPNSGTYSLADEYYTELQWALNCNGALDEHKYEFELWDITEGASIGTCLANITLGITPSGFKWNTKTILKWCSKVISKWNTK